jgi:hypothetical protein
VHVEHPRVSVTPVLIVWLLVKPRPAGQLCVPLVTMHRWNPLSVAVGTQTPAFGHTALETTESAQTTPCPAYCRPGTFVVAAGVHVASAYGAGAICSFPPPGWGEPEGMGVHAPPFAAALIAGELQVVAAPMLPLMEKSALSQEAGVVTSHEQPQTAASPLGPSYTFSGES